MGADYEVHWTDLAFEDLRDRVPDRRVQRELMLIALSELRAVPDEGDRDEGASHDGRLLWRVGITRADRSRLDPDDLEIDSEIQSWDFRLIYRPFTRAERRRHLIDGFVIEAVIAQTELWSLYQKLI